MKSIVPSMFEKSNPWMYCNYARMNPEEERCIKCRENCTHKGKHTIIRETPHRKGK